MRRIINNLAWMRSAAKPEDAYILSWLYNCILSEYSCLNSALGITLKFGSDDTHPDSGPRCSDCLCNGELRERMSIIVNNSDNTVEKWQAYVRWQSTDRPTAPACSMSRYDSKRIPEQ